MNATAKPYLGRCKSCDFTLFATAEDVREVASFDDVKQPGVPYLIKGKVFARCNHGHRVFVLKQIKGTYSPDHKCDARCLNARGTDCTCSCGGANHGRGHAVAVVQASEVKPQIFLGEVGKHIKGTAIVLSKYSAQGKTFMLYTFENKDKTATIKWFVPNAQDPGFEEGQEVTFRAKVKRHEDHERFGKATLVTYLQEV